MGERKEEITRERDRAKPRRVESGDRMNGSAKPPPEEQEGKRAAEKERKIEDRALVTLVSDVGRRGVSSSANVEKASSLLRCSLFFLFFLISFTRSSHGESSDSSIDFSSLVSVTT